MAAESHENGRYPIPQYLWYRGAVRRVYGVVRAVHQGHRMYILAYRRSRVPRGAATGAFGPRGRAGIVAVFVRADKVRPYQRKLRPSGQRGGRPMRRRVA